MGKTVQSAFYNIFSRLSTESEVVTRSVVLVTGGANGPVIGSPEGGRSAGRVRLGRELRRLAATLGLLRDCVPAEQRAALARPLAVERVAELGGRPEPPVGRAVSLLFAVDKAEWFHFARLQMLAQPGLLGVNTKGNSCDYFVSRGL